MLENSGKACGNGGLLAWSGIMLTHPNDEAADITRLSLVWDNSNYWKPLGKQTLPHNY